MNELGLRIKNLRTEKNLSQEEMANNLNDLYESNINKGMISKWESGKSEPRMDYVRILAKYFDTSVDYIICLTDNKKRIKVDDLEKNYPNEMQKIRRAMEELTPESKNLMFKMIDTLLENNSK